jgi:hypothetical protein
VSGDIRHQISAFSDVLNSFGGPGKIGMRGTDDAARIGEDASHGLIRLSNEDITHLGPWGRVLLHVRGVAENGWCRQAHQRRAAR